MCLYFRATSVTQGKFGIIRPVYQRLQRMLLQFSSFCLGGFSMGSRGVMLIALTGRDANKYHIEGNRDDRNNLVDQKSVICDGRFQQPNYQVSHHIESIVPEAKTYY